MNAPVDGVRTRSTFEPIVPDSPFYNHMSGSSAPFPALREVSKRV